MSKRTEEVAKMYQDLVPTQPVYSSTDQREAWMANWLDTLPEFGDSKQKALWTNFRDRIPSPGFDIICVEKVSGKMALFKSSGDRKSYIDHWEFWQYAPEKPENARDKELAELFIKRETYGLTPRQIANRVVEIVNKYEGARDAQE